MQAGRQFGTRRGREGAVNRMSVAKGERGCIWAEAGGGMFGLGGPFATDCTLHSGGVCVRACVRACMCVCVRNQARVHQQ